MTSGILLIEDEEVLAKNIKRYLERHGYETIIAGTAADGVRLFSESEVDLVLLDLNLPDLHGLAVLEELRRLSPKLVVICITGHGSVQIAVDAMKGGAYDFLAKPLVLSDLKLLVDKALGHERLRGAVSYYNSRVLRGSGIQALLGNSPKMIKLREHIEGIVAYERKLIEGAPPAVLIRGETGTGKELVARALHFEGPRQSDPFIELNCSVLPISLIEAELFGHERGAFTDAKERKIGLVEAADKGTLFLDEIGDIEPAVQIKLLKLLEDKCVRRVGGLRDRNVDVRFITATNRPLEDLVRAGKFRSDLYYRLRVVTIDVPPLREREEDALLLAEEFLALHARRYGRSGMSFSESAINRIVDHTWPGNVRELQNAIEQAVLRTRSDVVNDADLGIGSYAQPQVSLDVDDAAEIAQAGPVPEHFSQSPTLDETERSLIDRALEQTGGNVTSAAKLLGISRDKLRYRIAKHRPPVA
ncbi:sigma-54-dependent transcriptional regulator [Bradyrhizobium sp.]|uniref:sigma-54-dependent transcriptional regulator n=1 Tax=Bradyrhizobium sp. TaxID=376 RepID=UPI003C75714A